MPVLQNDDVILVRERVSAELSALTGATKPGTGQPLSYEFLGEVVSRAVIPILTSLISRGLYDVLKGKILGALKRKQTERISEDFVGAELTAPAEIDASSQAELRRMLSPLGFNDEMILDLYSRIRKELLLSRRAEPDRPQDSLK